MSKSMNRDMQTKERTDPATLLHDRSRMLGMSQAWMHLQRYDLASKMLSSGDYLDLGCGLGYGSKKLQEDLNKRVVSCDISLEALKDAKRKYKCDHCVLVDAQRLPFKDSSFDGVIAFEIIEHVRNGKELLSEANRILKKSGILFLSTPNTADFINLLKCITLKKQYTKLSPYHIHEYPYKELINIIRSCGFEIVHETGQILTFPCWTNLIYVASKLHLDIIRQIMISSGRLIPRFAHVVVLLCKKR